MLLLVLLLVLPTALCSFIPYHAMPCPQPSAAPVSSVESDQVARLRKADLSSGITIRRNFRQTGRQTDADADADADASKQAHADSSVFHLGGHISFVATVDVRDSVSVRTRHGIKGRKEERERREGLEAQGKGNDQERRA